MKLKAGKFVPRKVTFQTQHFPLTSLRSTILDINYFQKQVGIFFKKTLKVSNQQTLYYFLILLH